MSSSRVLVFTAAALAIACTEPVGAPPDLGLSTDTGVEGPLMPKGNLLIEEVYYSGAVPTAGIDRYYSDQFIELENIADAPVMVGGLIIGDAPGLAGAINPGNSPGGPFVNDPDFVYLSTAWRFPVSQKTSCWSLGSRW